MAQHDGVCTHPQSEQKVNEYMTQDEEGQSHFTILVRCGECGEKL